MLIHLKYIDIKYVAMALSCLLAALATPAWCAPAAQRYVWRNVDIGGGGGFVDGIVFDPAQPGLIYCRTDIGGVYRWDSGAGRWIPLTDWVGQDDGNLRGAESIAVDPTDPNRVYVAAGTYSQPQLKSAILISTDQGRTWKQTPMPLMMGGNEDGRGIGERLAVDPNHPATLYFGSRHDGLFRSDDHAATWTKVDSFPAVPDNAPEEPGRYRPAMSAGIGWVVFDPASSHFGEACRTIYVGVAAPGMQSLYRSDDAGATWQSVAGQPQGLIPHHGVLASDGNLYISYANAIGPNGAADGAVWKLNTRTGAWTDISPIKSSGFGGLAVDSRHPATVMVATLDHWSPGDEIFRSTDSGADWRAISPLATRDPAGAPWLDWGKNAPAFGWWIEALAIDPFQPGRVLYGTGATIWGTDDIMPADLGRPTHWKMYAEGIEETAVTALISPPAGAHLISGVGDIGGFTHHSLVSSPQEGMSHPPIFTTTSGLAFAWLKPSVIARVGTGNDNSIKYASRHGAYSLDGGRTWTPFETEPAGSRGERQSGAVALPKRQEPGFGHTLPDGGGEVAVTADGSEILWAPQDAPVSYSRDRGVTWTACSGLPAPAVGERRSYFGQGRLILAADPSDPNKVYALDGPKGALFASVDGGQKFAPVAAANLPPGANGLAVAPYVTGDLWVSAGDAGLWHSTDGGGSFAAVPSVKSADGIGFGKPAPNFGYPAIYLVGTPSAADSVHGVYRSDDVGVSWVRINDDAHQYGWIGQPVTGDPRVWGRVYVGTNGRGIVYGDPAK